MAVDDTTPNATPPSTTAQAAADPLRPGRPATTAAAADATAASVATVAPATPTSAPTGSASPADAGTAPPPSAHYRTARTVVAVVAIVALAGGIGGAIGGGRHHGMPGGRDTGSLVETKPGKVAPPDTVDLPGPQPDKVQGSGPGKSVRVLSQDEPGVTIELPGSDDETTSTTTTVEPDPDSQGSNDNGSSDPDAESGSSESGSSGSGSESDEPSGEAISLPGGVILQLADGWSFVEAADGYAILTTKGAAFYVGAYNVDESTTADDLVAEEVRVRSEGLTDVELGELDPIPVTTPHVSGAAGRIYHAILPNQNGSLAVEGDFVGIVTDLGYGYTITTMTQLDGYDAHAEAFGAMTRSLLASVGEQ